FLRGRLRSAIFLFAARCGNQRILGDRDHGKRKLRTLGSRRWSYQLADGVLADSHPVRNRAVAHSLALQHLDSAQTLRRDTPSAATPPSFSSERRHAAVRITLLIASNTAYRSTKSSRHVRLLSEARLHQEQHRIDFSDRVLDSVVMHCQSGDHDHA